jgi:hypothetical protein
MSLCNDGLVVCDSCRGLLVPDPAAVGELWPEWRHDPGFHVCLGCLRRVYADQYLADIAAMDALHRERQAAVTGSGRAAPVPSRPPLANRRPIPHPRQEEPPMNAAQMAALVMTSSSLSGSSLGWTESDETMASVAPNPTTWNRIPDGCEQTWLSRRRCPPRRTDAIRPGSAQKVIRAVNHRVLMSGSAIAANGFAAGGMAQSFCTPVPGAQGCCAGLR